MKSKIDLPVVVLLDVNLEMTKAWKKYFFGVDNIKIVTSDLKEFMQIHGNEIDAVVSPGNCFGLMDGGYDKAIIEIYGQELQARVRKKIQKEYFGEQPVGTTLTVGIPNTNKILVHVPTMRIPGKIKDEMVIYHCMRSALMETVRSGGKSILVPAFGGLTGQIPPEIVARMMWGAYVQLSVSYPVSTWEEVIDYSDERMWRNHSKIGPNTYQV